MHTANATFRLLILMLCYVLSLSACGFRLAGTVDLPEQLSSIYLSDNNLNNSQRRTLERRLTQAGATLVEQTETGAVRLNVSLKQLPTRQMATGAGSGANVKRLTRQLDYSVKSADGETIVPNTTLTQRRDASLNDDVLLSSDREEAAIVRELENALFDQMIRQLTLI